MELLSKSGDKHSPFLLIGKIVKAHGLRGGVKVRSFSDFPERFFALETVFLTTEADALPSSEQEREVDGVQAHSPNFVICYLEGIEDRNQAEAMVGHYLHIPRDEADDLPEDTFYIVDLIDFETYTDQGEFLGRVSQIVHGPQDLLEIETPNGKKHWVPFVKALVPEVNFEQKTMTIQPIEGLFDL